MIPPFLENHLEQFMLKQLFMGEGAMEVDFTTPEGESALADANSVSWRVFGNPVSLFIGGMTAVILELAEPRIRSGVWDHTTFRTDPLKRMRRTGLAAMVTVYGARSVAGKMIEGVNRMHARIEGTTPDGVRYRADDPELLRWVHATALYGFMEAYHQFVCPLSGDERDRLIAEGVPAAKLYGVTDPPGSMEEMNVLFDQMGPRLQPSETVHEFLKIMGALELFPWYLRPVLKMTIRASVSLLPTSLIHRLGLEGSAKLRSPGRRLLKRMGAEIEKLSLPNMPASQARQRVG